MKLVSALRRLLALSAGAMVIAALSGCASTPLEPQDTALLVTVGVIAFNLAGRFLPVFEHDAVEERAHQVWAERQTEGRALGLGDARAALPRIDYRKLMLQNQTVKFALPGMRIDLGGIAKGHAVDRAIEIARQCGIPHAVISAGGDSRILGDKQGRPRIFGIQHPRRTDELVLRLPLSNTAISTSGDYERFFIADDERIHHIINPQTGRSAKTSWSATVIGPDATTTDALSTTVFILGPQKGLQLIESLPGIDAIIIDSNAQIHYSSGLQEPPK